MESVYLQALNIYQTVQGEFYADAVATLNNLGVLHRMPVQHAQAEPLLTRALAIKEKLLARIIHDGSSLKRVDAKRDGHSET